MRPEELPEDIDGDESINPYNRGLAFLWQERKYWRHWKRVKNDTGRWPRWSIIFQVFISVGVMVNLWVFLWVRDTQNWSTKKTWLMGSAIVILWEIGMYAGREVVRQYETELYTAHEDEQKYFTHRG